MAQLPGELSYKLGYLTLLSINNFIIWVKECVYVTVCVHEHINTLHFSFHIGMELP